MTSSSTMSEMKGSSNETDAATKMIQIAKKKLEYRKLKNFDRFTNCYGCKAQNMVPVTWDKFGEHREWCLSCNYYDHEQE